MEYVISLIKSHIHIIIHKFKQKEIIDFRNFATSFFFLKFFTEIKTASNNEILLLFC